MKKLINILVITFMFSFLCVINIKAATGTITKDGKTYTYTWNALDVDFKTGDYYLAGDNVKFNINSLKVSSASGSVKITPQSSEGNVYCYIYKDDVGKPKFAETTYNLTPSTTTQPVTTTVATATAPATVKSNNANLKSLEVKTKDDVVVEITPKFDPSVYEYNAEVDSNVSSILVNTVMEDSKSNVIINGADDELKSGENNKITITVTAEDGTKKQYVLNVLRGAKSADATVENITIKEVPDFKFEEGIYRYTINVGKNVKSLNITVSLASENASYEITGNKDLKAGSKIKILVTAEDGSKKEYVLTISKDSKTSKVISVRAEKNPLIIMILSLIAFGLIGAIIYKVKEKSYKESNNEKKEVNND